MNTINTEMPETQFHVLDMAYIHQGWHEKSGVVVESTEFTKTNCDALVAGGLMVRGDDGWYQLTPEGVAHVKDVLRSYNTRR